METIRTANELHAEAVALLKRCRLVSDEERTPLIRAFAALLVEARQHFHRRDGSPDLLGKSYAYRQYVGSIYDESGLPKDLMTKIKGSVRYHVSSAIRERYDQETLEQYGFGESSARERSAEQRANKSALISALSAKDLHGGSMLALTGVQTLLRGINVEDLANLDPEAEAVARVVLQDVEDTARRLRGRLRGAA